MAGCAEQDAVQGRRSSLQHRRGQVPRAVGNSSRQATRRMIWFEAWSVILLLLTRGGMVPDVSYGT